MLRKAAEQPQSFIELLTRSELSNGQDARFANPLQALYLSFDVPDAAMHILPTLAAGAVEILLAYRL
jgi:hypothetical protein